MPGTLQIIVGGNQQSWLLKNKELNRNVLILKWEAKQGNTRQTSLSRKFQDPDKATKNILLSLVQENVTLEVTRKLQTNEPNSERAD